MLFLRLRDTCIVWALLAGALPAQVVTTELLAGDPQTDAWFGSAVALHGDTAVVGVERFGAGSASFGAAYVFERAGGAWQQVARLDKPGTQSAFDDFGADVAVRGQELLVGAPGHGPSSSGGAFVYRRLDDGWAFVTVVTSGLTSQIGHLGRALDFDGKTIVAGAPHDQNATATVQSGSVALFQREAGAWQELALLRPPDDQQVGWFGWDVGLSGNVVVVGEPRRDDDAGAAYVFERTGGVWQQAALLQGADVVAGDWFGERVAVLGRVVAVAAKQDGFFTPAGEGAVYLFARVSAGWQQIARLTADDGEPGDRFGSSVALSRDRVVVGALYDDDLGTNAGAAYVFRKNGGAWSQAHKLTSPGGEFADWFGFDLAVWRDRAFVGAIGVDDDLGPTDQAGAAYVIDVWASAKSAR